MKKCRKCLEAKNNNEFLIEKRNKDNMGSYCKICRNLLQHNYGKTKKGLIISIYTSQKQSSRNRKHTPPEYDLNELRDWALNQSIFHQLYENWVSSNYNKWMRPSCDRINSNLPYSLNNLKLMTWENNLNNNSIDIRLNKINNKGLLNGGHRRIIGINKKTNEKYEFISISEASRKLNINHSNISSVCLGNRNMAGGYIWEYKT